MERKVRLISIQQAAERLGVHQNTLRKWTDRGLVSVVRLPSGHRRFDPREVERVRRAMTPPCQQEEMRLASVIAQENRAAWLASAEAAGLSVADGRDELVARAGALGIDAHWMIVSGNDAFGRPGERHSAYVVDGGLAGEMLGADSVEEALRLVIGEALTQRAVGHG